MKTLLLYSNLIARLFILVARLFILAGALFLPLRAAGAALPPAKPPSAARLPQPPKSTVNGSSPAKAILADHNLVVKPTPGGLARVDPNGGLYPATSLADFSSLLAPPAGRFGFLSAGRDGHFHWKDGKPARFWGVSISRRSIPLPHQAIATVCGVLARSGCNLVRFEALDGQDGILSGASSDTQHLNPAFLDTLQFWIACLRARGIYYYLDLLDFRRFLPGDGLTNAGALGTAARPYAIFDPRLIDLQREYANQLLLAVNPYTHLRPVDDPALVMVELINEHGLFSSVTEIHKLAAPYNTELQKLWNEWLVRHYGSRKELEARWQAADAPLASGEDPTAGTVTLSAMPPSESGWDHGGVRSARIRDQVDFLADTQRDYFRTMRQYLRGLGLKCPITASVTSVVGPDVLSVADELDCTTGNFYADHPEYPNGDWMGKPYYFNDNQIRSSAPSDVAPQIAVLRWNDRPVVIREWCTAFPNHYRVMSVPDMAAYASLQDVDMVIAFTYVAGPSSNHLLDFAIQDDPTVWGLFGAGACIFLDRLVDPARYRADLVYSPYDLAHWGPFFSQLDRLAWCSQVRNVRNGAVPPPDQGISVSSGRGGWVSMPQHDSLIFQRLDAVPPGDRDASVQNIVAANKIPLTLSPLTSQEFRFNGMVYDSGQVQATRTEVGFMIADLPAAGFTPVAVDDVGQMAFGIFNPAQRRMVLPEVSPVEGLRAAMDLLHAVGASVTHDQLDADHWHSDTGQLYRSSSEGQLTVAAPSCILLAGEYAPGHPMEGGRLQLNTANPDGALVMLSLDSRPLGHGDQWLLKMVTHAENTGQSLQPAPAGSSRPFVLEQIGTAPVLTGGESSAQPTLVTFGASLLVQVDLKGGTWELYRHGALRDFTCDTPGIRVRLGGVKNLFTVSPNGVRKPLPLNLDGSFVYPPGILAVEGADPQAP